jgi:signal transduction histidine kinase
MAGGLLRKRSLRQYFFISVFVTCCWTFVRIAPAVTVTATATGDSPSPNAALSENLPEKAHSSTLTFDFTADPNFTSFSQHSRPLKSALLKLTITPEQIQLNPEALGIQGLTDGGTLEDLNLSVQVEVDLLELYEPDELLEMLNTNAGKIPISYNDSRTISSAQLYLATDAPDSSRWQLVVSIFPTILVLLLIGYIAWYRRIQRDVHLAVESGSLPSPEDERMAVVGRMASSVIHDVKNAFTAIRGCAEVIADDELDPRDRKDFAKMIVNEIDRGVDMTQELLEFTRGKARPLNLQRHSVTALLQEVIEMARPDLVNRNIALQTQCQDTGTILMDQEKMRRVFLNLITNARDAMPEGGNLTVTSQLIDGWVQIECRDTGCGISPELQTCMFQPLVSEGKAHGTGLGLAIVKDILDKHQASIEVESAVGQGTTFRILLPVSIPGEAV